MRIDLHTHSDRSDGTSTPTDLVVAASRAGLNVLALTDHDTDAGWAEATEAAHRVGIGLVPGMEISCTHAGHSLHLLAYLPDPTYEPLQGELTRIVAGREGRMPRICANLRSVGIDIDESQVAAHAQDAAAVGRPHVADALVALGAVADRDEAFATYLSPGRPGYVSRYAPAAEEMIGIVRGAGGVAVVAHPWGRTDNAALHEAGFAALRAAGLAGVEVDHDDHSPQQRDALRSIARNLDLVVTGSSDHHGTGKSGHALGSNTTDVEEYHRLLKLADHARRASGRRTPDVVDP